MTDVRRVSIYKDAGGPNCDYAPGTFNDEPCGTHALVPWEEWELLRDTYVVAHAHYTHRENTCKCWVCKHFREVSDE